MMPGVEKVCNKCGLEVMQEGCTIYTGKKFCECKRMKVFMEKHYETDFNNYCFVKSIKEEVISNVREILKATKVCQCIDNHTCIICQAILENKNKTLTSIK